MKKFLFISFFVLLVVFISFAQDKSPYVRIVNIVVGSSKLDSFKAALKKDIEASTFTEPGTITTMKIYRRIRLTRKPVISRNINKLQQLW